MRVGTKIIMIASGKGGTGKSTVSVLAGARLAARGKKVLLIELDSGLRSVDIISGVYGKTVYDIEDVLCGRCEGSKAVVESPIYPGLSVISAPYEGGEVRSAPLKVLVDRMSDFFDYILLDTAAGMGAPFQAAGMVSDTALLVLTPDPVALRDGHIVAEALFDTGLKHVRLVVNKLTARSFSNGSVRDLDECIDTVCAQLIAVIPESEQIMQSAANGTALRQDSAAFKAVDALAGRLNGEKIPLTIAKTGV